MGKMTSLLEKYKLIEKDEPSSLSSTETPHLHEEETSKSVANSASNTSLEQPISDEPAPEEKLNAEPAPAYNKAPDIIKDTTVQEADTKAEDIKDLSSAYNNLLNIEEVYEFLNLDHLAVTDTVFLLENLIKALPEELPEFVKKTTVNNIIEASAMNLPKLLEDGHLRSQSLEQFAKDYTQTNSDEITALKAEIERLSAIMAQYHQQIKYKETLIAEETNLIQTEQNRIQSILDFFNS